MVKSLDSRAKGKWFETTVGVGKEPESGKEKNRRQTGEKTEVVEEKKEEDSEEKSGYIYYLYLDIYKTCKLVSIASFFPSKSKFCPTPMLL